MTTPETRYAKTADGVHIAYQVVGDGPSTSSTSLPGCRMLSSAGTSLGTRSTFRVPTLILHSRDDMPEAHEFMTERIPDATLVQLP